MGKFTKFLQVAAFALLPGVVDAHDVPKTSVSNSQSSVDHDQLPLSMGRLVKPEPDPHFLHLPLFLGKLVSGSKTVPFSKRALFGISLNSHFQDLPLSFGAPVEEKPSVTLTARKPVFDFMKASNGSSENYFTACSEDRVEFLVKLTLKAEISTIAYQQRELGTEVYDARVREIAGTIAHAFQQAALQEDSKTLNDIFMKRGNPEDANRFLANILEIQRMNDLEIRDTGLIEGKVIPRWVVEDARLGPKTSCWKPEL